MNEQHTSPPATLSLDLDDTWAYLRTRGEQDWASAPSMLRPAVDRLLPLLEELGLRITVFVVGADAERPDGVAAIQALADAGHEIASHSWLHRADLASLPVTAIAEDLGRATDAITAVTRTPPIGFRCPSFGSSPALLEALVDGGFRYDASVLPTSLSPLLKVYYRTRMRDGDAGRGSNDLFGPVSNAMRPLTPFRWVSGDLAMLELPVSTVPLVRTPMHMSYLQALAELSEPLSRAYLGGALWALHTRRVPASFLLHPTDLVDERDAPRLGFFPGMRRPAAEKVISVRWALQRLAASYDVMPLCDAAARLEGSRLPLRTPGGLFPVRTASLPDRAEVSTKGVR